MVLQTKLYIPRRRPGFVQRPRLVERLNIESGRQVTLIAAPAGFGKTTLLAEWNAVSERRVTWVSLDHGDNDPVRFWSNFLAALQRLDAGLGQSAQVLLESPQPQPIETLLSLILNDVSACLVPFAHVFDDYHFIENPAIDEAMAFLLEHLPPNMRVIIASRVDPALPIARWRGRGQLAEIRARDLRFSPDEMVDFLNVQLRLGLTGAQITSLERRTEGWIAGLQLAALSLEGRPDIAEFVAAFTGSHRHVVDYLAEEVLQRQPADIQTFLLETSLLDQLCGPLCDALTGRTDGQEILEQLDRQNLFVVSLDDERKWYRYHHLFADMLRLLLQRSGSARARQLHHQARSWFEHHGLGYAAVAHALAGDEYADAARLIESIHGAMWQSGEIKTVQGWLAAMPAEAWQRHPRLWLVQAWTAMTVGDFARADADLRAAESALALADDDTARLSRPEVAAFRASYASLTQDPQAIELAQQALRDLPKDYWMRGMLVVFLSAAYYSAGDLPAASQVLAEALDSPPDITARQPHSAHQLALASQLQLAKGKLRVARRLLDQALASVEPGGYPIPYVGTLLTYMTAGLVLYEAGVLDQVEAHLTRCHALAVEFGSAEVQIYALSYLARVCLVRNEIEAAIEHNGHVEALLQSHAFSPSIMAHVDYNRLLLLVRLGRIADLRAWAETYADRPGPLNAYAFHRLALPQILLATGSAALARDKLAVLIQEADATGHQAMLLRALILEAETFDALGNRNQARVSLARALTLSEPEGFVRPYVDEGEPMRLLLLDYQSVIKMRIGEKVDGESLRILTHVDQLLAAFPQTSPVGKPQSERLPEPLSERELGILRLIATGRSNQEIADLLVIAVSTVKSHINNLYGKLGTNRRTEALAIARDRGLLSD